MELEELFTDAELEAEGVWVDAGDYDPTLAGLDLKVARMLNPAFARMFDDERRAAGPSYDTDEDIQTDVMIRCMAKTILMGWRNLTADGKAVKYSATKCEELLARSFDLRNVITRISRDRQIYRQQQDEDDRKN